MTWSSEPITGGTISESLGKQTAGESTTGRRRLSNRIWSEKLRQEWFEEELGVLVVRYVDREIRLAPADVAARWRRREARRAHQRWVPPSALEVFQSLIRWLRRRRSGGSAAEMTVRCPDAYSASTDSASQASSAAAFSDVTSRSCSFSSLTRTWSVAFSDIAACSSASFASSREMSRSNRTSSLR